MDTQTTQTTDGRPTVLILWSSGEHGVRSVGRDLAKALGAEPHGLRVVDVDLSRDLSGRGVVREVAGLLHSGLESVVLAALGWPVVAERLGGRSPRVVVALDAAAAAAADAWRGKGQLRAPLVGVVPGLLLDPAWTATSVDRLAVADPRQGEDALGLGLPHECLIPCGTPVCRGFEKASDEQAALRRRYGLPDGPAAVVVTDGLDPDQVTGALFQLGMLAERVTLLFDVAGDEAAAELLRRRATLYGVTARMFGKVDEAVDLWAASDVVVGRPRLYIEQRAASLRLPIVGLMPQGALERDRARLYDERGVGADVHNLATLAAQMDLLLQPERLQAARAALPPGGAPVLLRMARLVAQVGADAEAVLAEARARAEAPPPAEGKPPAPKGPLEVIGVTEESAEPQEPARALQDLEAAEVQAGRQVLEHQDEADRWSHRAELARERADAELVRTAEAMAEKHRKAMHRALDELARLARERKRVERPEAGRTRKRKVEQTFRQMELDEALAALKRKMGG